MAKFNPFEINENNIVSQSSMNLEGRDLKQQLIDRRCEDYFNNRMNRYKELIDHGCTPDRVTENNLRRLNFEFPNEVYAIKLAIILLLNCGDVKITRELFGLFITYFCDGPNLIPNTEELIKNVFEEYNARILPISVTEFEKDDPVYIAYQYTDANDNLVKDTSLSDEGLRMKTAILTTLYSSSEEIRYRFIEDKKYPEGLSIKKLSDSWYEDYYKINNKKSGDVISGFDPEFFFGVSND